MTKADIITEIISETGSERIDTKKVIETFMKKIKESLTSGENVYLRGFGSFIIKYRAEKLGRHISKDISIVIPEHNIPAFKPAKAFTELVKKNVSIIKKNSMSKDKSTTI
ncbi:HU family DNA-binding protein [Blattabacterium punctulatus]|uniref:Integration host factor subunit beta n=1 Tax=Blattabacterium punctulatus TaxID=164514 RepID=A0ABM6WP39_9FLAO|nr:HU family DNA-binding protein [Blattabacterium punctulatus]AWU40141.1 integration host factor subunit beta [Blattabacterium punctulatus]AWU40684.1 integration host factor subunit beta [Blattabacterium punctulatus]AWU42825.1 integration host factor subunit beta [Blattabacterium punctulatus]AWU43372.1 integration host factor subunit beta [Blattabacterium punctulatus]AWU45026.1 integration host factor subunit beta [Blattabacterium punctulatus]